MCFFLINLKAINLKWDLIDHDFSTFIKRMHCCRGSDYPSPGRRQLGLPYQDSKCQRSSINTVTSIPQLLHLPNIEKALGLLILNCRPHLTLNVKSPSKPRESRSQALQVGMKEPSSRLCLEETRASQAYRRQEPNFLQQVAITNKATFCPKKGESQLFLFVRPSASKYSRLPAFHSSSPSPALKTSHQQGIQHQIDTSQTSSLQESRV